MILSQVSVFQKKKKISGKTRGQAHTKLALKTLGLGNLVNADQRSVSDVVQDGVENSRLGKAIVVVEREEANRC